MILTASFQTTDCRPSFGFQWNLTKVEFAFRVHKPEGMDAETFHEPKRARDGAVGHHPHDHVHAFGGEADEIPEIIVSRLGLRKGAVRLFLHRVDQVRKLDRVLNEENRYVVADDVPVALLRVELHGEAPDVAGEIDRSLASGDGRKSDEGRRLFAGALEQVGPGVLR